MFILVSVLAFVAIVVAGFVIWFKRATQSVLRNRMRAWGRRTLRDFQSRIA